MTVMLASTSLNGTTVSIKNHHHIKQCKNYLHGVRLARASLSVSKDADIVSINTRQYKLLDF